MAYNKKLLYTKSFPSWNTPEGNLGNVTQNESPITPIQLVATELKEPGSTITYAVTTGSLPTGLTLSTSGEISGTLTGYSANETVSFSITATDDEGETAIRDFSLNVLATYEIGYLVVAGGGGGRSGGGGAGGTLSNNSITLLPGNSYPITVGAGGAGGYAITTGPTGFNGSNSILSGPDITTITSIGGGRGGQNDTESDAQGGGSGGGGGATSTVTTIGGSGTAGQGNNGGTAPPTSPPHPCAGGGGSGAAGQNPTIPNTSGNGGIGTQYPSITGTANYYAGGGGGSTWVQGSGAVNGVGGNGGGGSGAITTSATSNATPNTGGGGGGGAGGSQGYGGNGGSGVVILRIPTLRYSGTTTGSPTVTTVGSDTILTYTGSGTYTS